ncbi:MAG: hypothetical protein HY084_08625, partial [Gemmatimonadetes bacterium]|nr:hypothetical protein [Gemmatimonadota bacterium]
MPIPLDPAIPRLRRALAAAVAAAVLCAARPAVAQRHWTLGSPSTLVERLQGQPRFVERLTSLGYEVWHFDGGWVRLSTADDRVAGWSNAGTLKVEWRAGADTTAARTFTVGSTRDDVVRLEGTPNVVLRHPESGELLLRFGQASVRIGESDGRVRAWDDPAHALHARAQSVAQARAPRRPVAPASLSATVSFADDGDDGVLDAEERATVTAVVRNDGPGTAYGASIVVTAGGAALSVVSATRADSIRAGRTATLSAVVVGSPVLRDGELTLEVGVREDDGFDLDPPARVVVRTRATRAPRFVLDGIGIADQSGNGRIEPREIVDVTARVANRGAGDARDVHVTVVPGDGVVLTPETAREVNLGALHPGETRDVRFTAFSTSRAEGFPVSLVIREARERFGATLPLPLALDRPIASVPELVVRGHEAPRIAPAPLVADVDTGIPRGMVRRNVVAVVLGAERYEHAPAVPFARRDASVFREYASRLFGIGDDADRLFFRTDDELTGGELRKAFAAGGWLSRRVDAGTDVIVYFAGHGVADLKTHAPYLLPNDADPNFPAQTGYALAELYERLAALG